MANGGSVVVKIIGEDSAFRKTVSGLGKATRAAVKGLTIVGTALSAAWAAVGVTSVKYNAEVEQLQTSFKVMTGSADKAASVMERLRKLGATTPFATKDLASATQLLMQYGFNADDAIDRMSMLGDIAQGDVDKMMRIATAYGQMNSAGKVSLEDVKQMIEAGFNPLLEISESTGESMGSLYDRISKGTLSVNELTDSMRRATSEGGKFFGSMEAQSQTVSGLFSSLQDELQTLGGDIFEPISEALRTKVLPEAIRIVQAMQEAYADKGWDGLIDSLTAEIPKLLDGATAALEKLAGKLKSKLPGIIKKLIAALPSVLATVADSILPTLVDTIFEVVAVAVEELVGRLPELVPIILRGVLNLVKSVATGIWNVVTGLFDGLGTAMKKMGMLSLTPMEAFEQAWENTDTSQYKDIDVQVGVNITAEDYKQQIDDALANVRNVLMNVPGLTEDQRHAIETAIIEGTGIELVRDTLNGMNLPEGKAEEIYNAITEAAKAIDSALAELGLTDEQIAHIASVKDAGGDVQAALESYGVDPQVAKDTADTINDATNEISAAAEAAGIDPAIVDSLETAALSDKNALVAALMMLGIDQSEIQPIIDNYDALTGSLTASAKSIFNQIYEEYTNGAAETPEDIAKAKEAVKGLFTDAYDKVETWRQEALAELEASGMTGDALANAVRDIETEAETMITELNRMETEAMAWTEENANKSTEFVKGNLAELDGIVAQLSDINARIDVLTNEQFNASRSKRELVKAGAVTNVEDQLEAFSLTEAEMAQRIEEAKSKAGEALAQAVEDFADDAEAYKAREKEILDQLARDEATAYELYNAEMAKVISGVIKSSPELTAAIEDYNAEQQIAGMADSLRIAVSDAVNQAAMSGEAVDMSVFWDNIKAQGVDVSVLSEALGIDSLDFITQIENALKAGTTDTTLNATLVDFVDKVESDLSTALQNSGIDISQVPAIKLALEKGYLQAAGQMDWTNFETLLSTMLSSTMANTSTQITAEQANVEAAISDTVSGAANAVDATNDGKSVGREMGNGLAEGIKAKRSLVVAQARALAVAAKNAMETVLQIQSPSKVTKRIGGFFGEGFALGIEGQISGANRAAQRMAESAIGTIDAIGNNMNISQQANAGGMASAFQSMLAGMNLATDNGQPVQLYINGRLVAETIKRDIAQTQAGYNMDLARGVGKA